jgi:3-oxoadipate enol-lactonase
MTAGLHTQQLRTPGGVLAVHLGGARGAPAVVLNHSILSSTAMWERQVAWLIERGYRVVGVDTRGHGDSPAPSAPFTLDDLAADNVAVLDALDIARAHFVGLSLGGMVGLGLGIAHADRLLSLCICDARADAPPAVAAPWDERIAIAEQQGTQALAASTLERWFGKPFLDAHPDVAARLRGLIASTSAAGFVGCARAIQQLDYLGRVDRIAAPVTLVVGEDDGPLPQAMRELQSRIPGAAFEVIAAAGHLPNIDQPAAFEAALSRHFERTGA